MTIYTFSEARQKFASILNQAVIEGEVLVRRKDGSSFIIKPIERTESPLNVKGVNINISSDDIVDIMHEIRES
ncbi:type II toxin-antitoxin system Phd/YefM family antitoxin [bacterium]|nr:type II toxin-antitoxin system Phd/YefM family antitoxin [bacterium]